MVDVRRVNLPGVGVLHSFTTRSGVEVAVVAHRTGMSDLTIRLDGEEHAVASVRLEDDEARALADLLGGTRIVESITELDDLPGVPIDWVTIDEGDALDGRPLGELRMPEGVSIVALVREQRAMPSPGPEVTVGAGDILVAVGPAEGIEQIFRDASRPRGEGSTV
jgi:TrkA domain protein